uniref:Importin N-terminal domain-containing protein n=1 Tax=Denticeps clupeoides TaxID=299321 RepID=A0AAY4BCA4_9TELE
MSEELEQLLSQLTQPDNAVIQQVTAQLKQAFKDPAVVPALLTLCPQVRQSAAVVLRMRVKKHWKKISPDHRESLKAMVLQAFQQETEHAVRHSLAQLSAVMVKHETPDQWPALLSLLNQSTKSNDPQDRQVGLLLLSKVVESNPEPFEPHYQQLLQLFGTVLQDLENPTALYYCMHTLTAIIAFTGSGELNLMRSLIPRIIVALKHLIKADEDQASECMEVFDELMETEVTIIVPYIAEIVHFCLEVSGDAALSSSLRVKALSCIASLIRLKSKVVLKQKLLNPILQAVFPILSAAPPPGHEDPEDDEDDSDEDSESPKHVAGQVIDTMALHMPPEKLFGHLMPLIQACLASENPYERKGGLMCMAVLAEGCADHIRTKMLSSMLQTVCQSLSDSNQVVRSAGLFALGQFSEHLQPEVSKYHAELMPLLLGYMSSLYQAKMLHVTKAFYALENFLENLDENIQPYLPTLMETMLSALSNSDNLRLKELTVSAIGAIANAAKEMLVPYFPPVIESLKGFLTDTKDEMRALQIQALDTLSVLARTVGKDIFRPLAAECVQLGLNLSDVVDDPDLRRCTFSLFSAVSTVSPECLTPHLTAITTTMLMSLKSTEGVMAHLNEDKQFVLLDDDEDEEEGTGDIVLEGESEEDGPDVAGFSVENAYIDEKEDACDALGELAFNIGVAFQPFLESSFEQVYALHDFPHEDVRKSAFAAMGQFCRAQHKVWQENPLTCQHLEKFDKRLCLLGVVLPCFLEAVRQERERQVVMAVLEAMNGVIKSCQGEALQTPGRLTEICHAIRDVLKKKTVCQDGDADDEDDEQEAEYDAMLQEFAGEGIPLLASAVPAETFLPYLNDLLPLIMNKAKSSCTVADRSFSVGTIGETLHSLVGVAGGRGVAGRLSNRLLPVLVAGVKDSDAEVRNNSVYALGTLAEAAGPIVASYPLLFLEISMERERVIDNLCAALCRMILSNVAGVPLEQVFPVLVAQLPLKEDLEENKTVYRCLVFLYSHSPVLNAMLVLLQSMSQHHPQEFEAAMMSLPVEERTRITSAFSQS